MSNDCFEVRPGRGIGPIDLGMTMAEASTAASGLGVSAFTKGASSAIQVAGQLMVYFDNDRATEIEVAIPRNPADRAVRWQDIDFAKAATEVGSAIDEMAAPDDTDPEFPATRAYPTLGLSLWQEAKPGTLESGPYEAVLVRPASRDIRAR